MVLVVLVSAAAAVVGFGPENPRAGRTSEPVDPEGGERRWC